MRNLWKGLARLIRWRFVRKNPALGFKRATPFSMWVAQAIHAIARDAFDKKREAEIVAWVLRTAVDRRYAADPLPEWVEVPSSSWAWRKQFAKELLQAMACEANAHQNTKEVLLDVAGALAVEDPSHERMWSLINTLVLDGDYHANFLVADFSQEVLAWYAAQPCEPGAPTMPVEDTPVGE